MINSQLEPCTLSPLSIEGLLASNRRELKERWQTSTVCADTMFQSVHSIVIDYIERGWGRLERLAKRLMKFLRRHKDRKTRSRLLPRIREYRQGKRDQAALRQVLARELEGLLLEDAVQYGVKQGVFNDLGYSINLTPAESFETLYPKAIAA